MNCQTYRQKYILEPKCQEEDFLSHKQACSNCFAFTTDMMQFEQSLTEAIKVEPPDGLAQRILQRQFKNQNSPSLLVRFNEWFKRILYLPPIYAAAVSILLVITLFSGQLSWKTNTDTIYLKQDILSYLENTSQEIKTDSEVPATELRMMFQKIGAKMTGDIGKVRFCKVFTLHGYNSAYMVLSGTKGPINVLLIRDSKITKPQNINNVKFKGIIRATTWGNIAILGVQEEPLEQIAKRMNDKIIWL
jgi:hypothetical protein